MHSSLMLVFALQSFLRLTSAHGLSRPDHSLANRAADSSYILDRAIKALGGERALRDLENVLYQAQTIYRSQSIMQNYNLLEADVYVSTAGSQNISFSYSSSDMIQRIDRKYTRSEYWYFGQPALEPVVFSLVVKDGSHRIACYTKGNDVVFEDPKTTLGCADPGLAGFLTRQANLFSPRLLLNIKERAQYYATHVEIQPNVTFPAIFDRGLHITVILQPETGLPYIIRSHEQHYVLGPQTTDLQLTNYTTVNGLRFPRRFLTIVNNDSVLEDFLVENITVNRELPSHHFHIQEPLYAKSFGNETVSTSEYPPSEIEEFYRNLLWHGAYAQTYKRIETTHPIDGLTKLWHLMFPDADNYENLVVEFDDAVIVLDAPPHQSNLIKQWVEQHLNRKITHLWVTHHHRDHSGGAAVLLAEGAALIVPEVAHEYWHTAQPNTTLITYNDTHPYIYYDKDIQVRFLWEKEAVHALDWSYAIVTSACPGPGDGIIAFEADAWSPGTDAIRFDMNFARQWLRQVERDGLSRNASVVAVHGGNIPGGTALKKLIDVTGFSYPALDTTSWRAGGSICLNP